MAKQLDPEKRALVTRLILTGSTVAEIARLVGYSETYIAKLKRQLRSEAPAQFDYRVAKQTMRERSYTAINKGLEDTSTLTEKDRAQLGVQVLKGTGDLAPDHLSVFAQTWNTPPPALAQVLDACDRVRSGPGPAADAPVIDVELASESESKSGAGE